MALTSRRGFLCAAAGGIVALSTNVLRADGPTVTAKELVFDGLRVGLNVYDYGPGNTYFAPHNDETTCVEAALRMMPSRGGRLVQVITEGHKRVISFVYEGAQYVFDPNRIFTDQGIEATLKGLARTYSQEAHAMVRKFAEALLHELPRAENKPLIALHNNTAGGYSVASYIREKRYFADMAAVHVGMKHDFDDFFFVTAYDAFRMVAEKGFNAVLQSDTPFDDGSLAVYCCKQKIPYVNIEARHGHLTQQQAMIEVIS